MIFTPIHNTVCADTVLAADPRIQRIQQVVRHHQIGTPARGEETDLQHRDDVRMPGQTCNPEGQLVGVDRRYGLAPGYAGFCTGGRAGLLPGVRLMAWVGSAPKLNSRYSHIAANPAT